MRALALSAQPRGLSRPRRSGSARERSLHRGSHPGGQRRRPRPGRFGPPAALAAAVLAIVLVVSNHHTTAKPPAPAAVTRPRSNHHFWIVRPNQTLSEIVARTGVSLSQIEALNPRLNPGALQTGQHIRVRP